MFVLDEDGEPLVDPLDYIDYYDNYYSSMEEDEEDEEADLFEDEGMYYDE
jgi:hypothetical protein